jgi:LytR cell envelope-related transcriptional attenuator
MSGTALADPTPRPPGPPRRRADRVHTVGAAILAVLAILIGILLVDLLHDPSTPDRTSAPRPGATVGAATASRTPLPGIGPDGPATTKPSATHATTHAPSPTPSARTSAKPSAGAGTPRPASTPGAITAPVVIYNNSRIDGLAEAARTRIEAAGYPVERVGSVFGQWPTTTVYYDPPLKAAAESMVTHVSGIRQAKPRPSYLAATGTLILVVTKDFPTDVTQ